MLKQIKKVVLSVAVGCMVSQTVKAADLVEVYQQAVMNNYNMKSNYATAEASNMGKYVSLGALFPNLTLTGSMTSNYIRGRSFTPATDSTPEVLVNAQGNYQQRSYQLNLTQVLFNYSAYKTYKSSVQTALQGQATYNYQRQQLILNVAQSYYNILLAEDQLAYNTANVKALKSALDQAQARFRVGVSTDVDVKQADASYSTGIANQVTANKNLDNAYYSLFQLTGKVYKNLAPLKPNVQYKDIQPQDINYWVKQAQKNNQNYWSQKYQEEASYESLQAAHGAFMPTVSLIGQYSKSSNFGDAAAYTLAGLSQNTQGGYIGVLFTWNILNGGTDFATDVQAARTYEARQFTSLQSLRDLTAQTRQDYLNIQALVSQVKSLEQSVNASELAYKQFMEQYKVGTSTITDVLDQLQSLLNAQSQLAQAKYNYFVGILQLELDAGTISDGDINRLNRDLQS